MKTFSMMIVAVLALTNMAFAGDSAWQTNYEAAMAEAKSSGRPVFVEFTGSDWCPPCIKLGKDTFDQEKFKEFASTNLVLLELDYPQKTEQSADLKKQNAELSEKYKIQGFPTLLLLDANGKELARQVGYLPGGPDAMISWIEKATKG